MNEIYYRTLPATNLINVQWSGGNIISLFLTYSRKFGHPAFSIYNLPFPSGVYNPFAFDLRIMDPDILGPIPPYVDPISDDMMGKLFMWNGEPKVDHVSDIYRGFATLFFNVGKIRAENPNATEVTFMMNTPAGSAPSTETIITYWVWDTTWATSFEDAQLHPYTTGDPRPGHEGEIIEIPMAFPTRAEAEQFISYIVGGPETHAIEEVESTGDVTDNFGWGAIISSYEDKEDFPVVDGSPAWPESDAKHIFYESAGTGETGALPPYMVTFTINLETLEVSSTKV